MLIKEAFKMLCCWDASFIGINLVWEREGLFFLKINGSSGSA